MRWPMMLRKNFVAYYEKRSSAYSWTNLRYPATNLSSWPTCGLYMIENCQEMLFARTLQTDTKGAIVFETLKGFLKKQMIPMENIIACATDRAAAMVGKYRGFTAFLKKAIPHVMTIHSVVHRQHLQM